MSRNAALAKVLRFIHAEQKILRAKVRAFCRRASRPGRAMCRKCWKRDLAFQRRRYGRRKAAGICVKCGKEPAQATNLRGVLCQAYHHAHKKKKASR